MLRRPSNHFFWRSAQLRFGFVGFLAAFATPVYIAAIYAFAEEFEQAMAWLEIAYSEGIAEMVYLDVYPIWDPLRGDPRLS